MNDNSKGRVVEFQRPDGQSPTNTGIAEAGNTKKGMRDGAPPTDAAEAWESEVDPYVLARVYLAAAGRNVKGELALRYWRGDFYRFEGGRYVHVADDTIRTGLTAQIKRYFDTKPVTNTKGQLMQVTASRMTNAFNALRSLTAVDERIDQPIWLGPGEKRRFVSFTNGLVDLDQLLAGKGELEPHSPFWFSPTQFPFAFDGSATCARWEAFLDEVLEGDPQRIALIQEWVGYTLTPDASQQKFVVAEGDGANGKSVYLDTHTQLLGADNVSHVPLEMFGMRFQLTSTVGKLANICSEVGEIDRVAEGTLKQFTSGDRMHFDRKNLTPVEAYPTARLILATNNRPRFSDRSSGVWRRMIVIPFRVTIPSERQDKQLLGKLKLELPGIFNWAVAGLRRLREHGRFTAAEVCDRALEEYRIESNTAKVFLTEACSRKEGATVAFAEIYGAYRTWCQFAGYRALDIRQFGKEIRKAFPDVKPAKVTHEGRRARGFSGLELSQGTCVPSFSNPGEEEEVSDDQ